MQGAGGRPACAEVLSGSVQGLHVGVLAVFTKADGAFVRGGSGHHHRRGLVGGPSPGRVGTRGQGPFPLGLEPRLVSPAPHSPPGPHLAAGSSLAQQQVDKRQMLPRMDSREALQPR